jgi:hypothetical protein
MPKPINRNALRNATARKTPHPLFPLLNFAEMSVAIFERYRAKPLHTA